MSDAAQRARASGAESPGFAQGHAGAAPESAARAAGAEDTGRRRSSWEAPLHPAPRRV